MQMTRIARFAAAVVAVLSVACGSDPAVTEVAATPDAPIEIADLVGQMSDMAWAEEVDAAQELIEQQRPHQDVASPRWLVAASWLGRGASFAERWDVAEQYAREAYDGSLALLGDRELDEERQLPTALGAGVEVIGRVLDAQGDRAGAVEFLSAERERYRGTSIETRIQKNVLLLSLEGQPFPVLDVEEYLGDAPTSADALDGKVVVAYFWAHWCPDCKEQEPILAQLYEDYGERGLAIVGPTQLYGYVSRGEDATPEEELAYLRGAYQERFPVPSWMAVPISQQNFLDFGVSTTPTLVIIDREGIVQLYNPGNLPYEELSAHVERLL
jgi:thiol-disulfide isomerase/thioredoxin